MVMGNKERHCVLTHRRDRSDVDGFASYILLKSLTVIEEPPITGLAHTPAEQCKSLGDIIVCFIGFYS